MTVGTLTLWARDNVMAKSSNPIVKKLSKSYIATGTYDKTRELMLSGKFAASFSSLTIKYSVFIDQWDKYDQQKLRHVPDSKTVFDQGWKHLDTHD